jgi:hypothetical protein
MVDTFALGLAHLLLALSFWRLVRRADLNRDAPASATEEETDDAA